MTVQDKYLQAIEKQDNNKGHTSAHSAVPICAGEVTGWGFEGEFVVIGGEVYEVSTARVNLAGALPQDHTDGNMSE